MLPPEATGSPRSQQYRTLGWATLEEEFLAAPPSCYVAWSRGSPYPHGEGGEVARGARPPPGRLGVIVGCSVAGMLTSSLDGSTLRSVAWDVRASRLGGDYNPEQWPRAVWAEDGRLMREAGVNLVSRRHLLLGAAGARARPLRLRLARRRPRPPRRGGHRRRPGHRDRLPAAVVLRRAPRVAARRRDGRRCWPGGRQAFCPSSPDYRGRRRGSPSAGRAATPTTRRWRCGTSTTSTAATSRTATATSPPPRFRDWLQRPLRRPATRSTTPGARRSGASATPHWDEVLPPRVTPTVRQPDPAARLPPVLLGRAAAPATRPSATCCARSPRACRSPPTSWPMHCKRVDYWAWAPRGGRRLQRPLPRTAGDPTPTSSWPWPPTSTRGLAGGAPWLLMEHSTERGQLAAAQPRQAARASCAATASPTSPAAPTASLFFQWRASRAGAEKFHSALLPHAGTDTRLWREVVELGADLAGSARCAGSRVEARRRDRVGLAGLVGAWSSTSHPSRRRRLPRPRQGVPPRAVGPRHHRRLRALRARPVGLRPGRRPHALPRRRRRRGRSRRLRRSGGHLVVTYFSGIVDEHDHIRPGGYPGAFRDLLGVRVEEFAPLLAGERVALDDGGSADVWTEDLRLQGAEACRSLRRRPGARAARGHPARGRRRARVVRRDAHRRRDDRTAPGPVGAGRPASHPSRECGARRRGRSAGAGRRLLALPAQPHRRCGDGPGHGHRYRHRRTGLGGRHRGRGRCGRRARGGGA